MVEKFLDKPQRDGHSLAVCCIKASKRSLEERRMQEAHERAELLGRPVKYITYWAFSEDLMLIKLAESSNKIRIRVFAKLLIATWREFGEVHKLSCIITSKRLEQTLIETNIMFPP
ncbi:hypothetical protein M8C21_006349, partial [Ambrosia artemisiifolia]